MYVSLHLYIYIHKKVYQPSTIVHTQRKEGMGTLSFKIQHHTNAIQRFTPINFFAKSLRVKYKPKT